MARSNYIYVVTMYSEILGTFTVKHEMITWVLNNVKIIKLVHVIRYADGGRIGYKPVEMKFDWEAERGR